MNGRNSLQNAAASGRLSRRSALLGIGAVSAVGLSGRRASAQSLTKVLMSESNHLAINTPVYVAQRKGFFAKHGLEVETSIAGGIAIPPALLLANRAQFAMTGTATAVNATIEGGKMRCVAKTLGGTSLYVIGRPGQKFSGLDDFKNKTVATLRFPSNTISTPTYMMKTVAGFDPAAAGVNFMQLPQGALVGAVKDGRADIAVVFEWDASIARTSGLEVLFSLANILGPTVYSTIFVTETYLQANGETIQKLCNGLAEAMKLLHSDPTVFAEVSRLEFPRLDPEAVKVGSENLMKSAHVVPRNPIIGKPEWDAIMKHEVTAGTLRRALPWEEMVDNRFAEKATKEFGLA